MGSIPPRSNSLKCASTGPARAILAVSPPGPIFVPPPWTRTGHFTLLSLNRFRWTGVTRRICGRVAGGKPLPGRTGGPHPLRADGVPSSSRS